VRAARGDRTASAHGAHVVGRLFSKAGPPGRGPAILPAGRTWQAAGPGAHLRLRLEECADQVKAKNCVIKDIQKGNRELLQKNAHLETRIRELSDELMRTYRSRDFKTDDLDDTRTRLQHAQDELVAAQSYVHHLETELHEWDEQLEKSQAQAADL
jgi:chromosome segregation ATPase